jgi:L-arabinokinase
VTAVFYISGHGFGHASREVEVMRALARLRPNLRLVIRSAVNPALLERTLSVPFELRSGPCDTGIIQATSIAHDDRATIREAAAFYSTYDDRIDAEAGALAGENVTIIAGDIAPIAFEVAARLRVPGVAIGNFTWDWIYETHPGFVDAAPDVIPRLRASYRKATLALELPFAGGFEIFPVVRRLPLVARRATRSRAETRAHFGLPATGRVALLSFGGYGLPNLDLSSVDCLNEWTIVTTDRIAAPTDGLPPGIRLIAETAFVNSGFRYEDLVGASDVVVTKPGYGITAECISTGTAMLYTSRGTFREYDLLVSQLPRFVRCRFITQADLLGGRWRSALEGLVGQAAPPESMATDGAEHAARALSGLLGASTSG